MPAVLIKPGGYEVGRKDGLNVYVLQHEVDLERKAKSANVLPTRENEIQVDDSNNRAWIDARAKAYVFLTIFYVIHMFFFLFVTCVILEPLFQKICHYLGGDSFWSTCSVE